MSVTATHVESLIDLDRYPITQPASDEFVRLAADSRAQLDATGCCILPGFLTNDAVARCVREAEALAPLAHHSVVAAGTAYLELPDPNWPDGHARVLNGAASLPKVGDVLDARAAPSNPYFAGPR